MVDGRLLLGLCTLFPPFAVYVHLALVTLNNICRFKKKSNAYVVGLNMFLFPQKNLFTFSPYLHLYGLF